MLERAPDGRAEDDFGRGAVDAEDSEGEKLRHFTERLDATMSYSATPSPNGRNGNGKFAKGNAGGPGNPYARRVARLRGLMLDAVSDEDLKAIVSAMVEKAKGGDLNAAREVLSRIIGKPADAPDPDRLDVDAMGIDLDTIVTGNRCRLNRPSAFDLAMDVLDGD